MYSSNLFCSCTFLKEMLYYEEKAKPVNIYIILIIRIYCIECYLIRYLFKVNPKTPVGFSKAYQNKHLIMGKIKYILHTIYMTHFQPNSLVSTGLQQK